MYGLIKIWKVSEAFYCLFFSYSWSWTGNYNIGCYCGPVNTDMCVDETFVTVLLLGVWDVVLTQRRTKETTIFLISPLPPHPHHIRSLSPSSLHVWSKHPKNTDVLDRRCIILTAYFNRCWRYLRKAVQICDYLNVTKCETITVLLLTFTSADIRIPGIAG